MSSNLKGFTLIELTVTIGILGILATIVLAALNPMEQFGKAQDSKRKSDLAQIQRGLESYYQDYHRYPFASSQNKICIDAQCATVTDWGKDWRPYMDVLPIDPVNGKSYAYWTDSTGQSYALYASLDRGGKDSQSCSNGNACTGTIGTGLGGVNITCGAAVCNYGITSPNISP